MQMKNKRIHIYLFHIEELGDAASFDAASLKVDEVRKHKIAQYSSETEKKRSLGAGLLLQYAVYEKEKKEFSSLVEKVTLEQILNIPENASFSFRTGEMGKPYFVEYPDLFFSLSHSGAYVMLGVSNREIGVDIQLHTKEVKEALAKKVLTPEELNTFEHLELNKKALFFYRCWTIKESYCKLTGKGLSEGMNGIEIHFQEGKIYKDSVEKADFMEPDIGEYEYSMSICI